MAGAFEGKRALILGVANKRSIAWAIAQVLADGGARLAFTYQGERIEKSVRDLAATVDTALVTECDVRSDDDVARVFSEVGDAFDGSLDILVHSVAFAAAEDLEGRFTDTPPGLVLWNFHATPQASRRKLRPGAFSPVVGVWACPRQGASRWSRSAWRPSRPRLLSGQVGPCVL